MSIRTVISAISLVALADYAFAESKELPTMHRLKYPDTKRIELRETLFMRTVSDPYRWLENDIRDDKDVAAWAEAQNNVTSNYLSTLPGRDVLRERLEALYNHDQVSAPYKRSGRYFFTRNSGLQNQAVLYFREARDGKEHALIDPNQWSQDGTTALAEWSPSKDGSKLAYAVQNAGTDWRTIRVLDVQSRKLLDDDVKWARFTDIAWAVDGAGFFYSRFPDAQVGVPSAEGVTNHAVYYHALGSDQSHDRLLYATPDQPNLLNLVDVTDDGRYATIFSTPGSGGNALSVIDLATREWKPRKLIERINAEWTVIGNVASVLYIMTSEDAERKKIVTVDLADAKLRFKDLVPEKTVVLTNAWLVGGQLVASYLVDAKTELRRFTLSGVPDGVVKLPGIGSAGGFRGDTEDKEAFFIFTSLNVPTTIYQYDVAANQAKVWAQPDVDVDFDRISVEQKFYPSKDGTRVPMFVVRRKDVVEPAPTILYGYGGFGISMLPVYSPAQMAWVEQGGVLAVANIRGGGEYGRRWHDGGRLDKKQNGFDDFVAAGDYLKAERIASTNGLAVQGESGGGLLVGAVVNQRPDLFAAALPGVGVMDMLRYHKFTGGQYWMTDFGDPSVEADFNNLFAYSPYHNVASGRPYPAILATTADADDRVVPGHTFKYVAALQAADIGSKPHIVRIDSRAGHGAGKPMSKIIGELVDMWAFAAHWTGLKIETPR